MHSTVEKYAVSGASTWKIEVLKPGNVFGRPYAKMEKIHLETVVPQKKILKRN